MAFIVILKTAWLVCRRDPNLITKEEYVIDSQETRQPIHEERQS
jgi:hypothetical protein